MRLPRARGYKPQSNANARSPSRPQCFNGTLASAASGNEKSYQVDGNKVWSSGAAPDLALRSPGRPVQRLALIAGRSLASRRRVPPARRALERHRGLGVKRIDRVRATLVRMNLDLLAETLAGEPAYRARQVWEWAARGARSYAEMTNLPPRLRAALDERVPFSSLELVHEALAKDGTVKALFHTRDGHPVEAVLMRYRDGRRSVCISSQSGCPLTCTFCATGQMQFRRNLTAVGDPRPGAALPPDRADRPRRLHGHGRADAEPRRRARGGAPPARPRRHPPADDDLDGRLAAGPDALRRRGRRADPARALAARADRRAAQPAHAGQRPLSARGRARRVPPLRRAAPAQGVRRVRDARGRQRLASSTRAALARAPRPRTSSR